MVFQVPEWDDGNLKVKKNNPLKASPKNPKKNNAGKLNGVAEKSLKLIAKESKKARQQKQKLNKNKTNNSNSFLTKSNNARKKPEQLNGVSSNPTSPIKKNKHQDKNKNRSKSDTSGSSIKVDNIDVEKLDEVILNAKKKKFNEALIRDDVEHLLFKENRSPEAKRKPNNVNNDTLNEKKQHSRVNNRANKNSLVKNGKSPEVIKKKGNKTLNNKIIKAKNTIVKAVKQSKTIKAKNASNIIDEQETDTEVNENDEQLGNMSSQEQPIDKKKEKLKKLLQQSNRSPINMNRNKLRDRMMDRLKSAQFRFLNEKLYTSTGNEARELFQSDPAAFTTYHQGYQQQLQKWPINPLDVIVKRIKKMPKSHVIADMGCGSASLSQRVPHAVRSFDLVSNSPAVEVCDMAHTPLLAASVDAVVYCLALMGTDLTDYLVEANRVLKTGGHLLIAEVESRFTDVSQFTSSVQKLGFKLKSVDTEHDVFLFMEFVKSTSAPLKKAKQPVLTLKPCIYKRR